jgi:hypothetical protein
MVYVASIQGEWKAINDADDGLFAGARMKIFRAMGGTGK